MKRTDEDISLAERFPLEASVWGFGKSPADAKISPAQLSKLLELKLIQATDRSKNGGYAGGPVNRTIGTGIGRNHSTFIRTFKDRKSL